MKQKESRDISNTADDAIENERERLVGAGESSSKALLCFQFS